jgi:hypothetical protein
MKTNIVSLLLLMLVSFSCQDKQVQMAKKLSGHWNLKEITYKNNQSGKDSAVSYPDGHIYFNVPSGMKCENCSWYILSGTDRANFYYYTDPSTGSVFLNVGAGSVPVMPTVSFNGSAIIEEISSKNIILHTQASFKDKKGVNTGFVTHKAMLFLTK